MVYSTAMESSSWRQFKLMMWKNTLYFLRARKVLGQVLLNMIIMMIVMLMLGSMLSKNNKDKTDAQIFTSNGNWSQSTYKIAYYRDETTDTISTDNFNTFLQIWMDEINTGCYQNSSSNFTQSQLFNASSNSNLEDWCQDSANDCVGGVLFSTTSGNDLKYTVRVSEDYVEDTKNIYNAFSTYDNPAPYNSDYYDDAVDGKSKRFWTLQNTVDRALAKFQYYLNTGKMDYPFLEETVLVRYPYLAYEENPISSVLSYITAYMLLGWLYVVIHFTRSIVAEKENRTKEIMKLMGLRNSVYIFSWWVTMFAFIGTSALLWTAVIFGVNLLDHSSVGLVFLFIFLYALSYISFSFMIASLFSDSVTAGAVAVVVNFVFYGLGYAFTGKDVSRTAGMGICVLAPTCASLGALQFSNKAYYNLGIDFDNWDVPFLGNDFTFQDVIVMLAVDCVAYMLIALYIDAVFPGKYGIPEKWYFFLTPSYWFGNRSTGAQRIINSSDITMDPATCEDEPEGMKVGVQINNLQKRFGHTNVVNGLSFNMYEDQITSFLGHNGAGKTTTTNMLCGMYPCSGGDALVNGYSITTSMKEVRCSFGLCPQFDILFDHLDVEEHLYFYCTLKNIPSDLMEDNITSILKDMDLLKKRKVKVKGLSGGMKRKLSVAIALVGDSKIVMLDEPTAGMDPYSRRCTWDVLLKHKKGRTILLTTHFMDEADILGDRVAIIYSGVLKTMGSPLFLKSKYGNGYTLNFVRRDGCDVNRLFQAIAKFVPGVTCLGHDEDLAMESVSGTEVAFLLPKHATESFGPMLHHLDEQKEILKYDSYGVSVSTLEDVFIKVGEIADTNDLDMQKSEKEKHAEAGHLNIATSSSVLKAPKENLSVAELKNMELKQGPELRKQQFKAMFRKRILNAKRDRIGVILQIFIPVVFAVLAMILIKISDTNFSTYDALNMNFAMFDKYDYTSEYGLSPNVNTTVNQKYVSDTFRASANAQYGALAFSSDGTIDGLESELLKLQDFNNIRDSYASLFVEDNSTYMAYFNDHKSSHSSPVSLNFANNAKIRSYLTNDKVTITTTNWPLPMSSNSKASKNVFGAFVYSAAGMLLLLGLGACVSYYICFPVAERASQSRHLQFISGVDALSYWVSAGAWDWLCYLVSMILVLIVLLAFNTSAYSGVNAVPLIMLFLLYGFATIPLCYIMSFVCRKAINGYMMMLFFTIIGLLLIALNTIVPAVGGSETLQDILTWMFNIVPGFALGWALTQFAIQTWLKDSGFDHKGIWDFDMTVGPMLYLLGEGFLFLFLLNLIEKKRYNFGVVQPSKANTGTKGVDGDVVAEEERVVSGRAENDLVRCVALSKTYKKSRSGAAFPAVRNVTFGVHSGECFGLLGINGAGKTTTFKMLTGDESPNTGNAFINGHSIATDMNIARQQMGYCPQFDALIETLTGVEVLEMYARMRGVYEKDLHTVVYSVLDLMGIRKYGNVLCGTYSGGNKRKLSTAVALVGYPSVIFLDEPTTGMDPVAKRSVWNAISEVSKDGDRSVVLTTHSMEECEALCNRLTIMVDGRFKCIGSPQHLKNKFGGGYQLILQIAEGKKEALKVFMDENLPLGNLKEEHNSMLHYEFQKVGFTIGSVFVALEKAKSQFGVEDYALTQTSLEQVFIEFAAKKDEDEPVTDAEKLAALMDLDEEIEVDDRPYPKKTLGILLGMIPVFGWFVFGPYYRKKGKEWEVERQAKKIAKEKQRRERANLPQGAWEGASRQV
eukprot:Nk52_evm39s163 gene=Nk52_evmTU39s163